MSVLLVFSSVQSLGCFRLQPHGLQRARLPCPSPAQNLLKFMPIKSAMPSNHLILCRPPLLLPSVFLSIRVFSSESVLRIRWPKYWSFSFSISPFTEYSGLISFRIDWSDLLAVQGTLMQVFKTCTWLHLDFLTVVDLLTCYLSWHRCFLG